MTRWGVVALAAWGIAVFGANVSALLPDSLLGGLHSSRLSGANLNELRTGMAALEAEATALKAQNAALAQRFMLSDQSFGAMTQRVGALEVTIPRLLEALPSDAAVDRTAITASTSVGQTTTYDADGGSVSVTQRPLAPAPAAPVPVQPMPAALSPTPDPGAFGVALGGPIDPEEGASAWQSLQNKLGTLLIGLAPLLADADVSTTGKRLVIGPLNSSGQAQDLCGRLAQAGIVCKTVPFIGRHLPD